MKAKLTNIILIIALAFVLLGGAFYLLWKKEQVPGKLDAFAQCIKDEGAVFYGAFWCSHCQNQKSFFGKSKKYLPYVECSTADSNGQLQVCINEDIQIYPTWKFSDGSKTEGELSLKELSDKTGCQLPE